MHYLIKIRNNKSICFKINNNFKINKNKKKLKIDSLAMKNVKIILILEISSKL